MGNFNNAPKFTDYKNFSFEKEKPELPLKKEEDIEDVEKHVGAFSSTIILGDKAVKLNRILKVDPRSFKNTGEIVDSRQDRALVSSLAKKGTEEDATNAEVVPKLLELAEKKKKTYSTLKEHLGKHVPKLEFFAVVESPRRVLEESRLREALQLKADEEVPAELLEKTPTSEKTLMEIWENVGPENSLERNSYKELKDLYQNEDFLNEQKDLAQKAYELFIKEGAMLDLCDYKGIRLMSENDKIFSTKDILDSSELTKEPAKLSNLPLPRNLSYKDGVLKYYDLYPVWKIPKDRFEENYVSNLISLMKSDSPDNLKVYVESGMDMHKESRLYVFQYLALLKSMGAELHDSN